MTASLGPFATGPGPGSVEVGLPGGANGASSIVSRQTASSGVTIVINSCNDLEFLAEALRSASSQTVAAEAIVVVDDGSTADPGPIVAAFPDARLIVRPNGGLAAARNTGLDAVRTPFVLFLDADDRLLPRAIETGLAHFTRVADAAFVFGGYRVIDVNGAPVGHDHYRPIGAVPYADLLRTNLVAMHATVLYRTDMLRDVGAFDPTLRLCEDYDVYLRIARRHPVASHDDVVADYRRHGRNVSNSHKDMLDTVMQVHARHGSQSDPALADAWRAGRRSWLQYYRGEMAAAGRTALRKGRVRRFVGLVGDQLVVHARYGVVERIREPGLRARIRRRLARWPPRPGRVDLGDLGSTRPVSLDFGFDRGLPIDRYYIERFLGIHRADVRGRVLEVGDDEYSRRYGGDRIGRQDILHVHAGNPRATLVGDLADAAVVTDDTFDCLLLTQTLHLVYDVRVAIERMHASLRRGGVVLLTVPGITAVDRGEWRDTWYWSFHRASITRLFGEVFGADQVAVESYGNVYAATLYLQGLAVAEAIPAQLDVEDAAYPVILGVRAWKSS